MFLVWQEPEICLQHCISKVTVIVLLTVGVGVGGGGLQ